MSEEIKENDGLTDLGNDLWIELNKPYTSMDEVARIVATIQARLYFFAVRQFTRIANRTTDRPGSEIVWRKLFALLDSGTKVIEGARKSYNWTEGIKDLESAKIFIDEILKEGKISQEKANIMYERIEGITEKLKEAK